jgi:hypothetical protein
MIGASNVFELAVAVAISLSGLHSGAALATVVGVLVEVPLMLSLLAIANRNRRLFPDPIRLPGGLRRPAVVRGTPGGSGRRRGARRRAPAAAPSGSCAAA